MHRRANSSPMDDLPTLRARDLVLDPLAPEHAGEAYVAWLKDPDVIRYTELRAEHATVPAIRDYISATRADPRAAIWRILIDAHGHVGNIRLSGIERDHRRAAVAILIGARVCWGEGIAPRAIELLASYALGAFGLRKLTAGIYASHMRSRRAFEKAGFAHEASLREHVRCGDGYEDVLQFARFAERGTL